ncbi:hypothetical protein [Anatilimnocola floriformis]|uniref:hypothetical protein n=1 Tax=Anatilimnocola floriformis TaxID=2948575 RepID=UPI0020C4C505|nr:hypothetical protein [Anatilimnocola floriformis]
MFVSDFRLGLAFLAFLAGLVLATASRADEEVLKRRSALRAELQKMSDVELENRLMNPVKQPPVYPVEGAGDFVLSEMLKRDKKWAIPLLAKVAPLQYPWATPELRERLKAGDDAGRNIEVLTALRRAEGLPDPLEVVIDIDKPAITTSADRLPEFKVAVKNVDAKKEPAFLQRGGDYRTGRPERWRVIVKDEKGNEVKPILSFGFTGGGLSTSGPLEYGETWGVQIVVRNFIETPKPGKYTLQILFHNECDLARMEDIGSLIVCKSKPIELNIEKFKINVSAADAAVVRKFVGELDGDAPLKIAAGKYGRWAHDLISPNSAAGKLLGFGRPAVPLLIDEVQKKDLSPGKRAWLLSLLFSLTGENDPRKENGIVASYSYSEGPWMTASGSDGGFSSFGLGVSSTGTMIGGKIEPDKQLEFVVKWKDWLKTNCDVKIAVE